MKGKFNEAKFQQQSMNMDSGDEYDDMSEVTSTVIHSLNSTVNSNINFDEILEQRAGEINYWNEPSPPPEPSSFHFKLDLTNCSKVKPTV